MGPQIIILLNILNRKQKLKQEKDLNEKKKKMAGGYLEKVPGRPLPRAVATARVAPPPAHAVSVHPEPNRAGIRLPRTSSPRALTSRSRSRSASPANRNPSHAARLFEFRRRLAGATRRHCQIAWARRCAPSSSTSSPSSASRDAAVSPSSSVSRNDTAPTSSSIPAVSGHPRRHRAPERLRGEHTLLPDPFPLSIWLRSID